MNAQLEIKLIECLDALAQGLSLEQVLARYPDDAAQLRPLLETAQAMTTLRRQPSEAAKIKSRQNFLAQADLLRRTSSRRRTGLMPRLVMGFVAAAIFATVLSTGAVVASGAALPGDPLYGVKRTVENVRLSTAASASARQALQQEFDQRRRDEVNALLTAGRESAVEFSGPIEDLQPKAWIVGGLVVQLDANTQIVGTPQIDRVAGVRGVTGPNGLYAHAITIAPGNDNLITPTPPAQPTPAATVTPDTTPTPTKTAPLATATPSATNTSRPTPTTPSPTSTPQPVEVEFEGTVNAIGLDAWNIDGATVLINGNTDLRGNISVGQRVKVQALRLGNGQLIATRIELATSGSNGNSTGGQSGSNTNDNQNENQNENSNTGPTENQNNNSNENSDHNGNANGNDNGNSNEHNTNNSNEDHSNENGNDHSGNGNDG